jgi:hypothetical protein
MSKCIHIVAIGDYEPEMCALTIPTIRTYADKIKADFNLISKAKFPGFPPNYERFQIWEAGKEYEWNLNIDADFLIHPRCEDPTFAFDPSIVGALMGFDVNVVFKANKYFIRDGRNQGVVDNFTLTSNLTHDLWEPFQGICEELKQNCLPHQERRVSEYQTSFNLAKYGLKFGGIIRDRSKIYHINKTTDSIEKPEEIAKKILDEWDRGIETPKFGGAHDYESRK